MAVEARLDYSLSPHLTLQIYAQPLLSWKHRFGMHTPSDGSPRAFFCVSTALASHSQSVSPAMHVVLVL